MAGSGGRWYLGRVLSRKAARLAMLVVLVVFLGGFWLLSGAGVVEPGATVAVVGVILYVIVALPVGFLVGGAAEKKISPEE